MAQVKRNQRSLFTQLEEVVRVEKPLDQYQQEEKGHGRTSNWTVAVYNLIGHPKAQEWKNLRRLIHVHRIRKTKKGISHTDSFYISDLFQTQAHWFHQGIRGHWGIENRLHWVKDVLFKEDKNRIRTGSGPLVAAVISTMAINFHRQNGFDSITEGIEFARSRVSKIACHIRT